VIATAAIAMIPGAREQLDRMRKPDIVADAAHAVLMRDARTTTGHFFLDEDVLREAGVTDFSGYAIKPGVPLMPDLAAEFDRNPVGSMVTVRCWPWATGGRFVLLGDAAHAIVPFYGQGANASFEDCEALVDALDRHPGDVAAAIDAYQHERKPNADAIADMALANFIEMRDLTARRSFKWRKRRDHALHRAMPKRYVPLYDLVSFTTVPYAEARARAARQERLGRAATGALLLAVTALLVVAAIATWRSMAPDPHV
jgi:kynurenine 3-monooxygenase